MATVWKSLVRGVYDVDYWELTEGWHTCDSLIELSIHIQVLTELQALWHSINIRHYYKMQMGTYRAPEQ